MVGAGLTGLQAALQLKDQSPELDVLVVERAGIPRGASTRNAGFACFGGPTELLADLEAYGADAVAATVARRYAGVRALEARFARRGIGWEKHGGFELIDHPATAAMVRERLPALNQLLRLITGLAATWRPTQDTQGFPDGALLLHNSLEGQLHPGKLVRLLLEEARGAGVRFLFGGTVMEVGADAGAGFARLAEHGILRARRILVTVNAFAPRLLPHEVGQKIHPARNQILLSKQLPGLTLRGCYHYHEGYVYFRNVGPDRLLIGGARHVAGSAAETTDFGPNPLPENYLLDKLRGWLPHYAWQPDDFTHRWSGIIAQGDGKHPLLQYVNTHVLFAGRLAGMGVALSAELARRAAAVLLEEEPLI